MRVLKSMYWNNIEPDMIARQKAAVSALGFNVEQDDETGKPHGIWLDKTLDALAPNDTVLFLDIDCIPLTSAIVEKAFQAAEAGRIFGSAQVANYLDSDFIYAGPMFLCLSKATWEKLGRPSLMSSKTDDVGMRLSKTALAAKVPVDLVWPNFVCKPRWPMGSKHCFGIGTFYEGEIFHLFESRNHKGYGYAFRYVADCVISGRPIDYVELHDKMNSLSMMATNQWARIVRQLKRTFGIRR